ncbi:MAG TPA: hypothetical protein VK503_10955 [Candidatus Bathyarchaeia archaeon]|nr:hypothetical protein [Candidatus Bathyarchaeia archaeon]
MMADIVKESASEEHQKLVKALVDKFMNDGLEIVRAAYRGYDKPYKIGRYEPDVIARNPITELVVIGEAKRCNDLACKRTHEQFADFSSREMLDGKSKGANVPLRIMVPQSCANYAASVLAAFDLDNKGNIEIWRCVNTD